MNDWVRLGVDHYLRAIINLDIFQEQTVFANERLTVENLVQILAILSVRLDRKPCRAWGQQLVEGGKNKVILTCEDELSIRAVDFLFECRHLRYIHIGCPAYLPNDEAIICKHQLSCITNKLEVVLGQISNNVDVEIEGPEAHIYFQVLLRPPRGAIKRLAVGCQRVQLIA